MKFFRLRYVREIMIVFTGVCFLNMGFFLAEVAALELKEECSQLVGNLVNSGFEEERETESSGDSEEKEVDIMNHYSFVHGTVSLFSLPEMKYVSSDPYWDAHCPEKVCPPPEA